MWKLVLKVDVFMFFLSNSACYEGYRKELVEVIVYGIKMSFENK
jgi:hypothetical protein